MKADSVFLGAFRIFFKAFFDSRLKTFFGQDLTGRKLFISSNFCDPDFPESFTKLGSIATYSLYLLILKNQLITVSTFLGPKVSCTLGTAQWLSWHHGGSTRHGTLV